MFCFPAIFYHVGNPYTSFSYGFTFLHFFLFPLGSLLSVLQSCGGNTKTWAPQLDCMLVGAIYKWAATAGCGLHRVIAFGFRGIQECIRTIINKSTLSWWQQLLCPSGNGRRQLNSLINTPAIVHCALGVVIHWQVKKKGFWLLILVAQSFWQTSHKNLERVFSPLFCVFRDLALCQLQWNQMKLIFYLVPQK